jgi:hypothetical protein
MIEGTSIEDPAEAAFDGIEVEMEHLASFAPTPFSDGLAKMEIHGVEVQVQIKPILMKAAPRDQSQTSFGILRLESSAPLSLNSWLTNVRVLQRMMDFTTGRRTGTMNLRLLQKAGRGSQVREIALYLHQNLPDNDAVPLRSGQLAFTLHKISFGEIVPHWVSFYNELPGVVGVLATARDSDNMIENRLINAVTAAEALAGRQPAMQPQVFKRLRRTLSEAMNGDGELRSFTGWALDRLQNVKDLEERLLSLANRLGDVTETLIGDDGCLAAWAWAARKGRNDLAHTGRTESMDMMGMYAAVNATTAVVQLNILSRPGFTEVRLREVAERRYAETRFLVREHLVPAHASRRR